MSPIDTAASAATLPHVPPRGFVTRQLARTAITTIRKQRAAEEDGFPSLHLADRMASLEAEASHNPAGCDEGAAFQLSIALGLLDRLEDSEDVRAIERLVRHVLAHIGGFEAFVEYYFPAYTHQ